MAVFVLVWAGVAYGGGGPDCFTDLTLEDWYPPLESPFVFETFDLADGSGRQYVVRLVPCGEVSCPFEVQLRDVLTIYDTVPLDECALAQQPRMTAEDSSQGIGDPLRPDDRIRLWYTGYDTFFDSLHARPIDLAPGKRGLLVHMIGGYDHIGRHHYLFVVEDGRLVLAWSSQEVGGEDLIAVHAADVDGDGFMEILYFWGAQVGWIDESSGDTVGGIYGAVFRWDDDAGKIERQTIAQAETPAYGVIGGVFATAAAAYDAKFAAAACFWRYYVVPTDHLPDLAPGQYVLIAFTWDRAIADAESLAFNLSGDGFVATLTEFNPRYARLPRE
ncbi:MAG: hypothetical protein VCD33_16340 [Alphaproteobacteria bacterium]